MTVEPIDAPNPQITPKKTVSITLNPFCEAINPAVGKTAIVGIGGIIVSINAAMKTPANRYSESKSEIH